MSVRPNIAKRYDVEFAEFDGYTADECENLIERLREFDEDVVGFEAESGDAYELDREALEGLLTHPALPADLAKFVSAMLAQGGENPFNIVRLEFY